MSKVSRFLASLIRLNRYVPDGFPRKGDVSIGDAGRRQIGPALGANMFEIQAHIVDAALVDDPEPLLPRGRPYADLEKAAPRILSKDLHQACMNRLPVRSVIARQRMAPVKQGVVTVNLHQSLRSWSENTSGMPYARPRAPPSRLRPAWPMSGRFRRTPQTQNGQSALKPKRRHSCRHLADGA